MTARNQAPAKPEAPLENLKPRRGMLVTLLEEPDKEWKSYRKANWRTMRPANQAGKA